MHNLQFDTEKIPLSFRLAKGWRWLFFTFTGVLIYQISTLQRPGFGELRPLLEGRFGEYFRHLLGYYFLLELISVFIFLRLMQWYLRRMDMLQLKPAFRDYLWYQIKFLPFVLLVIPVFGPFTNAARYIVVFYPDYSWQSYFPEYFFTARMYVNYLLPFLVFGYIFMNISLFIDYYDWQKRRFDQLKNGGGNHFLKTLDAWDSQGETLLEVEKVMWFEVEGKSYRAYTYGHTYDIRKTLAELEEILDPDRFFRINRAVIINLRFFKNYSFWENDKYIVRLTDDKTEFVIQRKRLKDLRNKLETPAA